ncbi:MAG: response regulator [Thermoguttaceae bacterium]
MRVLLVEDDSDHAEFIMQSLGSAGLTTFEFEHVDCLAAAKATLATNDFEVVLLDLGLPDASGFEALREVRSQCQDLPIVVLTSNSDPSAGVEAAQHGAQDYMFKGDVTVQSLERILRYAVGRQQMYLQLHRANELLDQKNAELQDANRLLDQKNVRLAQLYETAQQFVDNVSHEHRDPRVLVVDDDREMLCGLDIRLTANGFEVFTATNGRTGVDSAIKNHPDAILMDNYMPVMDGLEALSRLHTNRETTDIPVIMLSASLRDQHKALEQGARFFLQKPCDAVTVVAALNEVIAPAV